MEAAPTAARVVASAAAAAAPMLATTSGAVLVAIGVGSVGAGVLLGVGLAYLLKSRPSAPVPISSHTLSLELVNSTTNSNASGNANATVPISPPVNEQPPSYEEAARLVADMRQRALDEHGIDCVNHINVCFAGSAGIGKSTLINAFRGLRNSHPLAARASSVEESTVRIQRYDYPASDNEAPESVASCLKLWDIPGSGTDKFPWANYFQRLQLYVFDFIVILCGDRVTEADVELASKAYYHEVPFAFVRSRVDQAIDSHMNDTGEEDVQSAVNEIKRKFREVCTEKMRSRNILTLPQTYLISAYAMVDVQGERYRKTDEDALLRDIQRSVQARRNRNSE